MTHVWRYNDINVSELDYSKPEKNGTCYFSSISYGDNMGPLYIQTPRLKCLTDIDEIKDSKNPIIEVEITDGNFDLYDFFLSVDDMNIKKTFQESSNWFSKELPIDAIDDMYKRSTQPFKKNSKPRLRFKLPVIKNKIQCAIYNQQKVFIDIDKLKKDCEIILIIHIRGLKILKQHFYSDNYITQIKIFENNPKYNLLEEYSLIDEEETNEYDEYDGVFDEEIKNAINEDEEIRKEEERKKEEKQKKEEEKINRIKELEDLIQMKQNELNELIN